MTDNMFASCRTAEDVLARYRLSTTPRDPKQFTDDAVARIRELTPVYPPCDPSCGPDRHARGCSQNQFTVIRLAGKRQGVELALSYAREYERIGGGYE